MDPSFKTQYFDGFAPEEDSDVDLNELDSSDEEKLDSSLNKYLSKMQQSPGTKTAKKRSSTSTFESQMEDELEEEMLKKEHEFEMACSGGQQPVKSTSRKKSEGETAKKVKFDDQVSVKSIDQVENDEPSREEEDAVEQATSKAGDEVALEEEEEDTDSEKEFETGERCTKKRAHYTNDELFYDPNRDEKDQDWINARRKTCLKKASNSPGSVKPQTSAAAEAEAGTTSGTTYECRFDESQTDAILNCPCCLTLLCMDCQRHEKYRTQFRAMFVFNCKVVKDEVLKYPKDADQDNKKKNARNKQRNLSNLTSDFKQIDFAEREFDEYKPVKCAKCETEVGVFEEKEELYHFFNVLTGH